MKRVNNIIKVRFDQRTKDFYRKRRLRSLELKRRKKDNDRLSFKTRAMLLKDKEDNNGA